MSIRSKDRKKPLVLVGFMASGKSTIGALLAKQLGMPFVDTDQKVEQAFGMTVVEIFHNEGEATFREAERATILRLIEDERQVIAVGGGAFVDPVTRARLVEGACTIWLDPPFEKIQARLTRSSDRPIAAARTDEELRELWNERRTFYAMADMRIENAHGDAARTAREIVARLEL